MGRKLVIHTVSEHNHGDSQEYLCLAYENGWGAGLTRNQLQFLADQINSGKIVLPDAPNQKRKPTFEERIKNAKTLEEFINICIERDIAKAARNAYAPRGNRFALNLHDEDESIKFCAEISKITKRLCDEETMPVHLR